MSLSSLLLYLILGLIALLVYKIKKKMNYWQYLGICCEEPSLLTGNLSALKTKHSFNEIWLEYYKKFKGTGPFAGFYWFQRPAVFILDAELAKHILIKDFNKFTDRGFYSNENDDPLTGHLFLLDGNKWKNMRSKLSPTFTSGKMKYMYPTIIKVGQQFVDVLDYLVKQSPNVEVKDLLARFTTDVIGTCAFGIDCNSLKDPQAEFRVMGKRALTERRHNRLGSTIISSFPNLARKLHMKQTPDHIEEFFLRIVRETVTYREQNNIKRNDFMDLLIDMKNNKVIKSEKDAQLDNLTMEQVAAQAFVFFQAGFETSSTTMGFALYELAQHPQIQNNARNEIISVLKQHNQEFTYDAIKKLQYLDQIISETLRLYTVLPVLNRKCLEDFEVPNHPKYIIKKDMPVLIPAGAIHRDPDYYPNPEVFNPDNFAPDMKEQRDSVQWLPFGDGPRNCIGMRFGLIQMRIGLALMLQNFQFSVCSHTQIPINYDRKSFLLSSAEGIHLKVERI